ncbi:MAG: hypothetical protein V1835_02845 [Candidatus Micrarchaeota archaeon]
MFVGWEIASVLFIAYMMARTTIKSDSLLEILVVFGLVLWLMGM